MMVLKNYMEVIVEQNLDIVIKNSGGCLCNKCRMDVMAMALNNLPAKYIVTEKGQLFTKVSVLRHQFDVDVVSAITNATLKVKDRPAHTQEDLDELARSQAKGSGE